MDKKFAIIVAGGSGSRMKAEIPKQFLLLNQKPIIVHTIDKFLQINGLQVILVIPENALHFWKEIQKEYFLENTKITVVFGGETRFQSVTNGLNVIKSKNGLVAVHDAVRPLISIKTIQESFELAKENGSAVVCVDAKDSIRFVENNNTNKAVERSKVKLIQTPQTFNLSILKKSYNVTEQAFFTDDASVVEYGGYKINLLEGDYANLKITTPEDLIVAEILIKNESNSSL